MFATCFNPLRTTALISCLCALTTVRAPSGFAQFRTVESGDRVRFTIAGTDSSRMFAGRFRLAARDSLYLIPDRTDSRYSRIARSDLREIQVYTGTTRRTGRGALLGLAAGSILGAGIGAVVDPCTPAGEHVLECLAMPTTRGGTIAFGAIGGGIAGGALGAIVGNTIVEEHWEPGILPSTGIRPPSDLEKPAPPVTSESRPSEVTLARGGKWSINVGFGTPADVSDDLHRALTDIGFGDDQICNFFLCIVDITFPRTTRSSSGFQLAIHRSAGTYFDMGIRYSRARLGVTSGYNANTSTNVRIAPEVGFAEAIARLKGPSRIHFAAGAGTYRLSLADSNRSPGLFIEWGLELIRWKNAYIFVEGRYRKISAMQVDIVDESEVRRAINRKVDLSSRSGAIGFGLKL